MAASLLEPSSYDKIEQVILFSPPSEFFLGRNGGPYPQTFHGLLLETAVSLDELPDHYLFTANSAIPLADTLRGFYDHLGLKRPQIGYINAGKDVRMKGEIPEKHPEELERLTTILPPRKKVCIVDQFKDTGRSANLAIRLVHASANPTSVRSVEGRWYHNAEPKEIDKDAMTSTHADFMYEVGVSAACLAMANL